jgi:hypothetical protein
MPEPFLPEVMLFVLTIIPGKKKAETKIKINPINVK